MGGAGIGLAVFGIMAFIAILVAIISGVTTIVGYYKVPDEEED